MQSLDVAVDGGVMHLLVSSRQSAVESGESSTGGAYAIQYLRSEDGGAHWSPPVEIPQAQCIPKADRGNDVQVAALGTRLLAVWPCEGDGAMGRGPMASAVSSDGGQTWSVGPNPASTGSDTGNAFIEISAAGDSFHLVWIDGPSKNRGLQYARSLEGGNQWQPNVSVDSKTCECCWNSTVVAKDRIYVLYRDVEPRDMGLALSRDGGRTWSQQGRVGAFDWRIEGCPHTGGALAVDARKEPSVIHSLVWTGKEGKAGVYYLRSSSEGKKWTEPIRVGDEGGRRSDLAAGEDGVLAAVWDSYAAGTYKIFGSKSIDGGHSWSPPERLSVPEVSATHPRVLSVRGGFRVFWTESHGDQPIVWKSKPM